ncbi:phosphate transport system substrate-binding protein [Herbihabitans rhizosphaerae]|uniref:Phosphate transport system substrate-binding protein n=1 Tax=Herbihabitans rhizosphaerae TaxID=1872711 RepID=A0A4Q7KKF4_9PSEU|nr:substrate-binding domain-containing protein [Herbihabitans rhizosphaerae]RZS34396.1 phosphate transport system substrate-binding protein [Herbihabitans rhizosphaerae]
MSEPTAGQQSIRELCEELLRTTYPDQDEDWIGEQTAAALVRITQGGKYPDQVDNTPPSASEIHAAAPINGGRRGARWLLVAAAVVLCAGAVVLAETMVTAAVGVIVPVGLGALAVLSLVATVVTHVRARRENLLSCRVRIDAPVAADVGEAPLVTEKGKTVSLPGVVVVRVKNAGGQDIEPRDYLTPLSLRFPGRTVVSLDATESEPEKLAGVVEKSEDFTKDDDLVTLPKIPLARGDSYKLLIFLSGHPKGEPEIDGSVRSGRITTEQTKRPTGPTTPVWTGLTAGFAATLAGVLLFTNASVVTPRPTGVACGEGELTVAGSTAFGRATGELAGAYRAYCHSSSISVRTPGSTEGLNQLLAADDRSTRLALSDGPGPRGIAGLAETKLAIVPFTLVASTDVPVESLTVNDARRIFTGQARTWGDITGNRTDTQQIRVTGRTPGSGTRRTLNQDVLGLASDAYNPNVCEADTHYIDTRCGFASTEELLRTVADRKGAIGYADAYDAQQVGDEVRLIRIDNREPTLEAIRAGYPFWAVEYLYSAAALPEDSLAAKFGTYLRSDEAAGTMRRFGYFPCAELGTLCENR